MAITIKNNVKYRLAAPTSMGVRLTPEGRQPIHTSDRFIMHATSAETNALSVTAALSGGGALALTAFVKESCIAEFIKADLRKRRIDYAGKDYVQGGPWGLRHQFNIADSGFGLRGPCVQNDRAGEVGRLISADDFDLDKIFCGDGVGILHISGLFAALSESTGRFCVHLAETAKKSGTAISFDLNYRASFWTGREKELSAVFKDIALRADILEGNEEDFQLCLGLKGPKEGGQKLTDKIDDFITMIENAKKELPGTKIFATTLREVISADRHLWGSVLCSGVEQSVIEPREISVLDRIGGGDGFVGGLLYGVGNGWNLEKCNRFAWASGALAVTMLTDYASPTDEEQVFRIYEGNARVKR